VRVVSAADASAIGEPVDGDSEAITALALSPGSRLIFAAGHSSLLESGTSHPEHAYAAGR